MFQERSRSARRRARTAHRSTMATTVFILTASAKTHTRTTTALSVPRMDPLTWRRKHLDGQRAAPLPLR